MNKQICPKCNKSHYSVEGSVTTLMAYVPTYKDGVLVNRNPNVTTTTLCCHECGHSWEVK